MSDTQRPPRDDIFRAVSTGIELERAKGAAMPTMRGHFSVFNEWTTIDSAWEGTFRERVAPGAFQKTMVENRSSMLVLYDHGHDQQMGNRPIGPITELREDDVGAYYEVPMLDTTYNRDLLPALEANLLGASFRFRVIREEFDAKPKRTDDNPDGMQERTILEASVREFGPVSFPAYPGATAGVARSVTDDIMFRRLVDDPGRLAAFATLVRSRGISLNGVDTSTLEPDPSGGTTPSSKESEPSEATTRSGHGLFWFVAQPGKTGA